MDRRTFLASVSVLPVALSLGGCGDDQFPDYRYRMTVYVGDKPFSSVRAVLQEQVSSVADSSGQAVKRSLDRKSVVEGKSVSVRGDIGGRRIINKKNKNKKRKR